jgi:hypothetical protein
MQPFIEQKREEIAELCRTHHVRRLSIFGSAVREDFDPERSDVDVRVEFEQEGVQGYADNYFEFCDRIAKLLGRKVDVVSGSVIQNSYFRKEIEESQVTLYAA